MHNHYEFIVSDVKRKYRTWVGTINKRIPSIVVATTCHNTYICNHQKSCLPHDLCLKHFQVDQPCSPQNLFYRDITYSCIISYNNLDNITLEFPVTKVRYNIVRFVIYHVSLGRKVIRFIFFVYMIMQS